MLGSSCCCPCPSIVPYRQKNTYPGFEEYNIPESVEVDISFSLPQDELWIETRKNCCPGPPTQSSGVKYKRPASGVYSLSPTGFGNTYEYTSRDLYMRATVSKQYLRDGSYTSGIPCLFWGSLEISFGSYASISRTKNNVAPVTDAELTAALSGYSTYYQFARYCRQSTRNFQNVQGGGCVVGEWDELYQLTTFGVGQRLPQEAKVPFTANVTVPAIELTLEFLQAYDPCYYVESPFSNTCFTVTDPQNYNPQYVFSGTTLVSRTWQAANQGVSSLPGTLTINSAVAKRAGLPDLSILDIP